MAMATHRSAVMNSLASNDNYFWQLQRILKSRRNT